MNKRILLFFLVGFAIYLAETFFNSDNLDNDIYISDQKINNLILSWNSQVGRNPNADELINLINNLIEEEILFREALKLGLDKDDEIIRRRLAQKIIFLKRDPDLYNPSDKELMTFFDLNRKNYIPEDLYTFEHYFFGDDASAKNKAQVSMSNLLLGQSFDEGIAFYSGSSFSRYTIKKIEEIFGIEFSKSLATLETNQWQGPIISPFGYHNVKVTSIEKFLLPNFNEVKDLVLADYIEENLDLALKEFLDQIKNQYSVAISPSFDLK